LLERFNAVFLLLNRISLVKKFFRIEWVCLLLWMFHNYLTKFINKILKVVECIVQ
jgi:hypothetical protein